MKHHLHLLAPLTVGLLLTACGGTDSAPKSAQSLSGSALPVVLSGQSVVQNTAGKLIPSGKLSATAAAVASCAAAWDAKTAYTGGKLVSENGRNYVANWWTQGNEPLKNNGATGTGQPWTDKGACGGSGTGDTGGTGG
uniref:carbohydrate-binding protein n=1 Tax=Undibacterium luofuense TaxID=2828733 RepID=UPI0030EC046F